MTGREMAEAVRKSWPMDGDTYMAGCVCHCGGGRYHIEFIRYRNSGGIVGRLSPREVAAVAPGLVAALRNEGAKLRAYLAAEDGMGVAPQGVGSSDFLGKPYRTRDGAGGCECNGATRSGYARSCPSGAASASPDVGHEDRPDGGFARVSRLTARDEGEGQGASCT